jgi:hypothetical protein
MSHPRIPGLQDSTSVAARLVLGFLAGGILASHKVEYYPLLARVVAMVQGHAALRSTISAAEIWRQAGLGLEALEAFRSEQTPIWRCRTPWWGIRAHQCTRGKGSQSLNQAYGSLARAHKQGPEADIPSLWRAFMKPGTDKGSSASGVLPAVYSLLGTKYVRAPVRYRVSCTRALIVPCFGLARWSSHSFNTRIQILGTYLK